MVGLRTVHCLLVTTELVGCQAWCYLSFGLLLSVQCFAVVVRVMMLVLKMMMRRLLAAAAEGEPLQLAQMAGE